MVNSALFVFKVGSKSSSFSSGPHPQKAKKGQLYLCSDPARELEYNCLFSTKTIETESLYSRHLAHARS